ncbi:polyphosphate polymerase domain-containing protein [Cellulomonas marina]|nr:polyphosphate polymerase domain-containing protein [Cellulomonas marina]
MSAPTGGPAGTRVPVTAGVPPLGEAVLHRLPPVGLAELVERASRQTRVDRKYVVPLAELDHVLAGIGAGVEDGARVLEIDGARSFAYESVYFDTPDLVSYLGAARRRRRRFKVRTRTYVDAASCWVEVKTRGTRGTTVKERLPYDLVHRDVLDEDGLRFTAEVLDAAAVPLGDGDGIPDLRPTLVSRYRRATLHLPATDSRTTIDTGLTWTALGPDGTPSAPPLALAGMAVVETKTGSTPSSTDRLLWRHGYRPVRISKYGTGMAALHPGLPATPWHRVLTQDVGPHLVAA